MPYVSLYFVQNTHWPMNADANCKADFFSNNLMHLVRGDCKLVLSEKVLTTEKLLPPHKRREDS